jgi:hypothetical protein
MIDTISWSYSTVNTFRECNRKYYFSVLATHGRKEPLRRKAYELKKMQTLTMWKGSVVDKFMEKIIIPAIVNKLPLDFEQLAEQAVEMAKRQFKFSRYKNYQDPFLIKGEVDNEFCILDIHEVDTPYEERQIAETYALIRQSVLNIPDITMPDGQLLIDFLKECNSLLPNINNWAVEIEIARVKPQIDLIAYHNWKPVVIDWKLSESYVSDYARQLVICGITIYLKRIANKEKDPYQYTDIKLFEVNLLKGIIKEHAFTQDVVNDLIDNINLTSKDMSILADKTEGKPHIDDFDFTDDEGHCRFCNYRSLCSYLLINKNGYDEKSYTQFVQNSQFV